jgi:ketosteroid isomerase-like protein
MTERTTERTRAIVEGYFDAISTVEDGGIDRALAFMTEDVVWQNPASIKQSGIFNGRQAVRELLSGAIGEVYVPHSLRNLGRSTLVEGNPRRYAIRHFSDYPTGPRLSATFCDRVRSDARR